MTENGNDKHIKKAITVTLAWMSSQQSNFHFPIFKMYAFCKIPDKTISCINHKQNATSNSLFHASL